MSLCHNISSQNWLRQPGYLLYHPVWQSHCEKPGNLHGGWVNAMVIPSSSKMLWKIMMETCDSPGK